MNKFIILIIFFSTVPLACADISINQVLATLRKLSIAANGRDIDTMVSVISGKGMKIEDVATKNTVIVDQVAMRKHLRDYFRAIEVGSYTYGVQVCSIDKQTPKLITVTLKVYETFKLVKTGELKSTNYRESVTFGVENGLVVLEHTKMGVVKNQSLK